MSVQVIKMTDQQMLERAKVIYRDDWATVDRYARQAKDAGIKQRLQFLAVRGYHYEEACCGLI